MKILFYGTKNYDEEFFEKLLPSIQVLKLNLQKQIFTKKPHPLLTAMKPSVLS